MRQMMTSWLAEAHAGLGENDTALSITEQVLADISDATGRSWQSELNRQRAQFIVMLDSTRASEAEADLKRAIEVARRQNAKSLELRAATSLQVFG